MVSIVEAAIEAERGGSNKRAAEPGAKEEPAAKRRR